MLNSYYQNKYLFEGGLFVIEIEFPQEINNGKLVLIEADFPSLTHWA